ncbi:glycoside hydrolase family protein [Paraburkholderia atlantica]|uniref:glycoside hydrolase family protein n=1 Tax=Paraburkholderia atlantica TaxID=2654982 RepID=UPI000A07B900
MTDPLHECITNTNPNSNVTVYSSRLCKPWKFSARGTEFLKGWEQFSPTNTINRKIRLPLFQFEYDALVCFMYNLQHHGDSLLDFVNTGDYNKVGDRIRQYATVKGKPLRGLLRRRHREAEMFEAGVYDSSH